MGHPAVLRINSKRCPYRLGKGGWMVFELNSNEMRTSECQDADQEIGVPGTRLLRWFARMLRAAEQFSSYDRDKLQTPLARQFPMDACFAFSRRVSISSNNRLISVTRASSFAGSFSFAACSQSVIQRSLGFSFVIGAPQRAICSTRLVYSLAIS
jgi:hypothetical protein